MADDFQSGLIIFRKIRLLSARRADDFWEDMHLSTLHCMPLFATHFFMCVSMDVPFVVFSFFIYFVSRHFSFFYLTAGDIYIVFFAMQ